MSNLSNALAHMARPTGFDGRSVNLGVELTSTMLFDTVEAFEIARSARYETGTLYYGRYGSSPSFELERMFAALEGAHGCTLTSSGVAAITLALMGVVRSGDHILVADHVYGNTRNFCDVALTRQGVAVEYYDPMIGGDIVSLFQPNTSVIMFESPGSGTFEVPDIRAIASAANQADIVTILDNTWSTPILSQPIGLGVDVVVHSGSKYICGHSDAMIGFISCNEKTFDPIRKMVMTFGDKPGAQEIFLALRGLRTLEMRMAHFGQAGRTLAEWFCQQPQVKEVLHPALPNCPGHEYWMRDYKGSSGLFGVIFEPCSDDQINAFVNDLSMFGIGVSWGGFESLALPVKPVRTAKPWQEDGQLVRFNVGLENLDSLIGDLQKSLPLLSTRGD